MGVKRRCPIWITFSFIVCPVLAHTTLRFVVVVWRHGDRSPALGTFPTDTENGESTWPQGFAELSQLGMREQQYLGEYLRRRYMVENHFLSSGYEAKEIYIRSTSFSRTLMSASSNLAGVYPTGNGVEMLVGIPVWQPIPVHSQPRDSDPMLFMELPCPRSDEYQSEVMNSDPVKKIELENKDFLDFLKNKTGFHHMALPDVWKVWDPLNCERIHNDTHKWPDWVTVPIFERVTYLTDLSTTFYYPKPRIQRFRGSLLFNDVATRMDQKANDPTKVQPPELKYVAYSAHDTTIIALLENLGAYDGHFPEYASAVLFELHEKQPKVFTVETWYANETWASGPPVRVAVKGCDDHLSGECSLETFVRVAGSNVPKDWYTECGDTIYNTNYTFPPGIHPHCHDHAKEAAVAAIALAFTTAVFLMAFLLTLSLYCRLRRNKIGR